MVHIRIAEPPNGLFMVQTALAKNAFGNLSGPGRTSWSPGSAFALVTAFHLHQSLVQSAH